MSKIGVFGGSFNPVHLGHIYLAQAFYESLSLDKCLLTPAKYSPLKSEQDLQHYAEDFHRLKMLEIAIKDFPYFEIENFELQNDRISFTINTLKYLRNKYSDSEFFLLIGTDQYNNFNKWKDFREILNIAKLCVVERPNENIIQNEIGYIKIQSELYNISSTQIRKNVKSNLPIDNLVNPLIENYIYENKLYL